MTKLSISDPMQSEKMSTQEKSGIESLNCDNIASTSVDSSSSSIYPKNRSPFTSNQSLSDPRALESLDKDQTSSLTSKYTSDELSEDEAHLHNDITKGFASAFRSIMNREIDSKGAAILAERPEIFENLKNIKREVRQKKQEQMQKKLARDQAHEIPNPLKKDHEKKLRKIANSGVLKLFNAIIKYHKESDQYKPAPKTAPRRIKKIKHAAVAQDDEGKSKFLKILKKK